MVEYILVMIVRILANNDRETPSTSITPLRHSLLGNPYNAMVVLHAYSVSPSPTLMSLSIHLATTEPLTVDRYEHGLPACTGIYLLITQTHNLKVHLYH